MMLSKKRLSTILGLTGGLALVVSPVIVSAASDSANTTINANIGSSISISSNGTVSISVTPTAGGVVSSASDTVTVSTNNTSGYALSLADADAVTNLVSGGNNIAAHSGTHASPTALTGNSWGYAVAGGTFDSSYSPAESNNGSSTSKWAGMPASGSGDTIKTTGTTASGDTTTVWYGVRATSAQPNGTYSDTVTYTATTNP